MSYLNHLIFNVLGNKKKVLLHSRNVFRFLIPILILFIPFLFSLSLMMFNNLTVAGQDVDLKNDMGGNDAGILNFKTDSFKVGASYPGENVWNRIWGGESKEYGYSVWGDGTFIYTCGSTESFGAGGFDLTLIKWDLDGNQVWNRTWGGPNADHGYSVWGDGTFIYTCGSTENFGAGGFDLVLIKWDSDGNQVWNRTCGGLYEDSGYSVWGDGTYIYTCGYIFNQVAINYDLLLVKWDAAGNQLWNRSNGGLLTEQGYSIWGDGTFIYTCGYTSSYGAGDADLFLVKWDDAGNQIWYQTWGGSAWDEGSSIWGDGTYIYTCGSTESYGAGIYDLVLVKWDMTGNQLWNRTWGGAKSDYGKSVIGNGTYIYTCGWTQSFGAGNDDLFFVRWDLAGNQEWNRTWGLSAVDYGSSVYCICNAIYTYGSTYSFGAGYSDQVLVKWDASMIDYMESDTDGDGLLGYEELYIYFTNASNNDTDSDNLSDYQEIFIYLTNASSNDTDADGLSDYQEIFTYLTNATSNDTDLDGLSDGDEIMVYYTNATNNDTDGDSLPDGAELLSYLTNPNDNDTDNDGLIDSSEIFLYFSDATDNDTDADGLADGDEIILYSTSPINSDSDSDDLSDGDELFVYSTSATNADTDNDGLTDGDELLIYFTNATSDDTDGDWLTDRDEILRFSTNATNEDTDSDGLSDYQEIFTYSTNATSNDTDLDGLSDGDEIMIYYTNATNNDTDGDNFSDFHEIEAGTDPTEASSYPTEQATSSGFVPLAIEPVLVVITITFIILLVDFYKKKRNLYFI
ncbi:MAG: hypothetical protein ACTSXP_13295 [Promethearchaeota archaeon]